MTIMLCEYYRLKSIAIQNMREQNVTEENKVKHETNLAFWSKAMNCIFLLLILCLGYIVIVLIVLRAHYSIGKYLFFS